MKKRTYLLMTLLGASSLALPFAVMAADTPAVPVTEAGAKVQTNKNVTIVTLSASDEKQVDQDLLMTSLRIEMDEKDARKLQDEINKSMQKAMEATKAASEVKVSTGQYYVYQLDPNPSSKPLSHAEQAKRMIWRGSQTIDLQSKDAQSLLDVVGKIQEMGFVMNGLNYALSTDKAEAQKDELLAGALQKIQKKAELIAKALGKTSFDIDEVNVEGANMPTPQPMMMKAMRAEMAGMASDAMAAPVAAPGQTAVNVSVTARITLK